MAKPPMNVEALVEYLRQLDPTTPIYTFLLDYDINVPLNEDMLLLMDHTEHVRFYDIPEKKAIPSPSGKVLQIG